MEAETNKDGSSSPLGVNVRVGSAETSPSPPQPITKKPRGRPPGSKNKPKEAATVFVPPQPPQEPPMMNYFLEVPGGSDVVQSIVSFAGGGAHKALTVLSVSGMVADIPRSNDGAEPPCDLVPRAVCLMSLSGYVFRLPDGAYSWSLSASFVGNNGQVTGGLVSVPLMAAGPVVVVVAAFKNISVVRLPSLAAAGNQRNAENGVARMFNSPNPAANGFQQVMPSPDVGGWCGLPSRPPF